jgi:hypothetical protein
VLPLEVKLQEEVDEELSEEQLEAVAGGGTITLVTKAVTRFVCTRTWPCNR